MTASNLQLAQDRPPWFAYFYYAPLWSYLAFCGFFVVTIETPLDSNHILLEWECLYVGLPLALIVFGSAYRHRLYLRRHIDQGGLTRLRKMPVWVTALVFYMLLFVFGLAFPLIDNATGGTATPVVLQGPIIEKQISGGRSKTYILVVDEQSQHHQMRFSVSQNDYNNAFIGENFSKTMRIGRLGIPYRWIWEN